ncbi:IPExxxVDY family protein [Flavobacterium capsici]|uniref:IPExxxVDY family protein n=1 Tax=Flavobacterium capsici TaxID=3075618 RepID=A0AA96F1M7_9FLAO|nr:MULTISPECIES: IPExxxVDY family protein [unclassified Flavobacterium]WNM19531.1 IPExxxVDY family protein [Flavobacterium sp. PMR2A8]WNM20920.1 IPExxxVDY family protein [Flavobacterium sp. PMTSA4]
MAKLKLLSEEYEEIDYQLIAIHTSIEDYRLAFLINKNLPINLSKCNQDIEIQENNVELQFSRFSYDDEKNNISWNLIQNKNQEYQSSTTLDTGLFANTIAQVSTNSYILPEFKKVDYFLKVDNCFSEDEIQETLLSLKNIQKISTVYTVAIENIKSKNNLIF